MSDRRTFLKIAAMGASSLMRGSTASLAQTALPKGAVPLDISFDPIATPSSGKINVAFVISDDANVVDIAGPWEVFNETMLGAFRKPWHDGDRLDSMSMPFETYTVSDDVHPIRVGNGMLMVPSYNFETAPRPQVIVIPAQTGRTEAQKVWLLSNSKTADLTMSVCTGVTMLAQYGMLDGLSATTHHSYATELQKQYPSVHFVRAARFIDHGKIATAGGLASGIDLALHVVARYYGQAIAQSTADTLEYHSELWRKPNVTA